jgi:hypothetical protein
MVTASDRALMVRRAFTVIWPEGWSPWVLLGHLAVLVGAAVPLLCWRRRASLERPERYAAALSLIALTQLLVMVPVAVGLTAGRYLFIPRMFIFATVSQAVLIAVGFWWSASMMPRTAGELGRWAPAAVSAVVAAAALSQADQHTRGLQLPLAPVGDVACDALRAPVLHLLEPEKRSPEFTPNVLVRLGRALDSCAAVPVQPGPPRYLMALESEGLRQTDWMRVEDRPLEGFQPLHVCGRPVVLESGHARFE